MATRLAARAAWSARAAWTTRTTRARCIAATAWLALPPYNDFFHSQYEETMKTSLRSLALAGSLLAASAAFAPVQAAELHVLISGGFSAAYEKLGPEFTKADGPPKPG